MRRHPKNPWISNAVAARMMIFLTRHRLPVVSRVFMYFLGCDIGLALPKAVFLPHPMGIVIHSGTCLGDDVVRSCVVDRRALFDHGSELQGHFSDGARRVAMDLSGEDGRSFDATFPDYDFTTSTTVTSPNAPVLATLLVWVLLAPTEGLAALDSIRILIAEGRTSFRVGSPGGITVTDGTGRRILEHLTVEQNLLVGSHLPGMYLYPP